MFRSLTVAAPVVETCALVLPWLAQDAARVQSVLEPAGPAAEAIEWLWWVLFWVCTAVFVLVLLLTAFALLRHRRSDRPGAPLGNKFILLSGVAFTSVVVIGLLFASIHTTVELRNDEEPAVTVVVVGKQWWWEVHYPDYGITIANEIQIPAGVPVKIELRSDNVIHSFWVPRLAGKMDLLPGVPTSLILRADAPGTYRGQCAEYCGVQHALMAFYVVAMPPEQFDAWVKARLTPPPPPASERLQLGLRTFLTEGCSTCHAIRGTPAEAKIGPDLTHMGSRLSIGAGTLPNTPGNLAGWISNPQPLKPGNKMPPSYMTPEELLLVTEYLQSLE